MSKSPMPPNSTSAANELSHLQMPLSLEKISVGFASPTEGYFESQFDFNEYLASNQIVTIVVRCGGDSMLDTGIFKDDLLVTDRSVKPMHRDIVMADLGNQYIIRRLYMINGQAFIIQPFIDI